MATNSAPRQLSASLQVNKHHDLSQSKSQLWISHQVKVFSLLSDFNDIYLSPDKFSRNTRLCVFTYNTVISDSSMSFSSEAKVTLSKVWFCSTPSQSSGTNSGVYFHHRFTAMLRSYERTWWNLNSEELKKLELEKWLLSFFENSDQVNNLNWLLTGSDGGNQLCDWWIKLRGLKADR